MSRPHDEPTRLARLVDKRRTLTNVLDVWYPLLSSTQENRKLASDPRKARWAS
jgi:hypothetical protein